MIVKTEKIYRSVCSNGIILENDSDHFKELFRSTLYELRGSYGHSKYYEYGSAVISYGVLTSVYIGSRIKSSYIELRQICHISVTSIDNVTLNSIERW